MVDFVLRANELRRWLRPVPSAFELLARKAWLNKIVVVGVGQVDLSREWVGYKVYEVG